MWSLWHSLHNHNACPPLSLTLSLSVCVCAGCGYGCGCGCGCGRQQRRVKLQAHMCSEFNLFRQHGERLPTTCKTISSPFPPSTPSLPALFLLLAANKVTLTSPGSCTCSCNLPDSPVRKRNGRGIRTQNNVLNAENEIQGSSQTSPSPCPPHCACLLFR